MTQRAIALDDRLAVSTNPRDDEQARQCGTTAYHEAGHAVASYLPQRRSVSVSIASAQHGQPGAGARAADAVADDDKPP